MHQEAHRSFDELADRGARLSPVLSFAHYLQIRFREQVKRFRSSPSTMMKMRPCGSSWKPFCGFQGAVGAFFASIAPGTSVTTSGGAFASKTTRLPIEVLDVISEDNSGDPAVRGQRDLERGPLHVTGDRARDGEPRFRVVGAWRKNQCGTSTPLLVTGMGIKHWPNQITCVRNIRAGYHLSWPTDVPQSISFQVVKNLLSWRAASQDCRLRCFELCQTLRPRSPARSL